MPNNTVCFHLTWIKPNLKYQYSAKAWIIDNAWPVKG